MDSLRTFILDRHGHLHRIVCWKRGICMLVEGKLDVLENYEVTCNSPSVSFQIPAVAVLKAEVGTFKKGVKFSRINVLARDKFVCCYCGSKKHPKELTYDHVMPRSRGGKTNWKNIVTACAKCNRKKGSKTPHEAGLKMHFKPYKPEVLPLERPLFEIGELPDIVRPYVSAEALSA